VNPQKVNRDQIADFTDLPNIGPAMAKDFEVLGVKSIAELKRYSAWELYENLTLKTGQYQDPCVLDVFISVIDFLEGNPPRAWWEFTEFRKSTYGRDLVNIYSVKPLLN
jgi:hypothetical protein